MPGLDITKDPGGGSIPSINCPPHLPWQRAGGLGTRQTLLLQKVELRPLHLHRLRQLWWDQRHVRNPSLPSLASQRVLGSQSQSEGIPKGVSLYRHASMTTIFQLPIIIEFSILPIAIIDYVIRPELASGAWRFVL